MCHLIGEAGISPGVEVPHLQGHGGTEGGLVEGVGLAVAASPDLQPNPPQSHQHQAGNNAVHVS